MFGIEKLEWVLKILKICLFVLRSCTNVDGHTHTHRSTDTAWWHRPRLCITSRGKNPSVYSMKATTCPVYFAMRCMWSTHRVWSRYEWCMTLSRDLVTFTLNCWSQKLCAYRRWRHYSRPPPIYPSRTWRHS